MTPPASLLATGVADDAMRSCLSPPLLRQDGGGRGRARSEPMLALINVAFLLLVFMLLLGPASPTMPGVTLPMADAVQPGLRGPTPTLALDSDGQAWAGAEPIGLDRLVDWVRTQRVSYGESPRASGLRLELVADATLEVGALATVLGELAAAGVTSVHLRTRARSLPPGDGTLDR